MAKDMYQKRKERQEKKKNESYDEKKTNINWYPGHMAKTKREIIKVLSLIDIVYELVDARLPESSKIANIDSLIKNKPRILIMTKSDLCDIEVTKKWVKKYEDDGYKVLLINNKVDNIKGLVNLTNELMINENKKRKEKGLKEKEIKILVIGIPNVGKSTLINKLTGKKSQKIENRPGVTQNLTWLKTPYNIKLLDTPGILWPKLENEVGLKLALTSSIKSEVYDENEVGYYYLQFLQKYYPNILKNVYKTEDIEDIDNLYLNLSEVLNIKSRDIEYERINQRLINDLKNESVKNITFDRK